MQQHIQHKVVHFGRTVVAKLHKVGDGHLRVLLHNAVGVLHGFVPQCHCRAVEGGKHAGGDFQRAVGLCPVAQHPRHVPQHIVDGIADLL
ncbi:hypothetical protein SDC9_107383 [bioreactor metagenome]|uniref:Uncharacterized protein n=1 Tax=bioreactor metagenome TaxID=1076179 RepID=A0A645B528_9ZZZZ